MFLKIVYIEIDMAKEREKEKSNACTWHIVRCRMFNVNVNICLRVLGLRKISPIDCSFFSHFTFYLQLNLFMSI